MQKCHCCGNPNKEPLAKDGFEIKKSHPGNILLALRSPNKRRLKTCFKAGKKGQNKTIIQRNKYFSWKLLPVLMVIIF